MSFFCDDVDAALGGYHTSAYIGLGLPGAQVPSAGADGPSALYPCITLPADAAVEVFMQLTRLPTLGVLTPDEDGSFLYVGASDYFEFRLWADGIAFVIDIGHGPGTVRVLLTVGAPRFVILLLTSDGSTPLPHLSGLRCAFFDQLTPDLFTAPVAKFAGQSTDAFGILTLNIAGTALASGGVGWLVVTDSDGRILANGPSGFSGPVQVF